MVESDAGEVRAAELRRQQKQIEELRDALDGYRGRADAAAARAEAASKKAQTTIDALQAELAKVRLRADAAAVQSDKALSIATEFLSNLVAAREAQTTMVERNISMFNRVDERLAEIEARIAEARKLGQDELQAAERARASAMESSQKDMDQQLSDLRAQLLRANLNVEESRKRSQAELATVRSRSADMEQRMKLADQKLNSADQKLQNTNQKLVDLNEQLQKSNQDSEKALTLSKAELAAAIARSSAIEQKLKLTDKQLSDISEQLLLLDRNVTDTRAAIDSGPMLDMLRRLETTQRDTAGLRGLVEEMQQEQQLARKRMQDYYLDLDARIQDLQNRERAAREAAEAQRREAENAPLPPLQEIEIPDLMNGNPGNGVGEQNSGAADANRPQRNGLQRPNQIQAKPLPDVRSTESSLDAGLSGRNTGVSPSPAEPANDDSVVGGTDRDDIL